MERETFEVTTPIGKQTIELKSWLTGGESEAIEDIFLADMESTLEGDIGSNKIRGQAVRKAKHLTLETVIVAIDGAKENILKTVLNMRKEDYDFVAAEVDKIASAKSQQETVEKKSESGVIPT